MLKKMILKKQAILLISAEAIDTNLCGLLNNVFT